MQLHYLYSDKRTVKAAVIKFDGQIQKHCTLVNDDKGFIIRRTFKDGLVNGSEKLEGKVEITIPKGVPGGPYQTKLPEKVTELAQLDP